jgi:tetratricopeptide (TPR) repeat protein
MMTLPVDSALDSCSVRSFHQLKPAVLAAFGLTLSVAAVRADDWTDCVPGAPRVEAACTAVIEKAERSPQDLAVAYARRGDFYRSRRMSERAFADYAEALRLDPRSWEVYYQRGLAYRDQRKLDEAIADFEQAIAYAPERPNPRIARGSVLELRNDNAGALKEYDQTIALRPDFWFAYSARGALLTKTGDLIGRWRISTTPSR